MPFGERIFIIFNGKKKRMQKITKLSALALLGISLMSLNAKSVHAATMHVLDEAVTKVNGTRTTAFIKILIKMVRTRQSAIPKILNTAI